jgi:hypothetical protein
MWSFGCHSEKTAPVGSASTAMRPMSMTSNDGAITVAPAASAIFTVWSASSTLTYEFQ